MNYTITDADYSSIAYEIYKRGEGDNWIEYELDKDTYITLDYELELDYREIPSNNYDVPPDYELDYFFFRVKNADISNDETEEYEDIMKDIDYELLYDYVKIECSC